MFRQTLLLTAALMLITCNSSTTEEKKKAPYTADWESLASHNRQPEWFKDAKFGIYFHWGVYSVPAYSSEWYPRWMYVPDRGNTWGGEVYSYHVENFGPPTEFNYHDFIPLFKAEKFNAVAWAALFKEAGAKFGGLVAQHHDGFAMWGSDINPWNVRDRGPKKDITGELLRELKKLDMKTITTFHHARLLQRYAKDTANWAGNGPDIGWNSHYPYHPDYATSSTDPDTSLLYGNIPEDQFHDYWLNQVNEVVDKYAPDIIWFDSWLDLIPEEYLQNMVAHHFNTATLRGQEPIACYKQEDLPANVGVLDMEQGGKTDMSEDYWLTDITLSFGSWCYTEGQSYKDAALVVRNMIDVWSKKGVVLLNISPKADGSIPEEQQIVLKDIGKWMKRHAEAVYNTRNHSIFGYGIAEMEDGHFGGQSATIKYSENDVRFTTSKDGKILYAFILGLPAAETDLTLKHLFDPEEPKSIKKVRVVGSDEILGWTMNGSSLSLRTPAASEMDEIATVFRIEFE